MTSERSQGRTGVVRELVQRHKELVNAEDEESDTPLHVAATYGQCRSLRTPSTT